MSSVQQTIFDIIAKEGPVERELIKLESTLADLQIESLTAVEIVFAIEDKFDINIPDRDPKFDTATVGGLVDSVERLLAAKQGSAPAASS